MKWFHKHRQRIYLFAAGIFILGSFAGFGGYLFQESPFDAAIVVNGRKIPYKRYDSLFQRVLEDQRARTATPLTDAQREFLKRQVVQALIQEEVFVMKAEELGLSVPDGELAQMIQHTPAFLKDGTFDPRLYQETLSRLRMNINDFEKEQRRQILAQKAQFVLASGVTVSSLEAHDQMGRALAQATPEDRKKIAEDPRSFRESLRQQEMQYALQSWYNDFNTRLKIKISLSKIEGPKKNPTPSLPTPAPAQP